MEFSGAAEGLGYNDEALKDLFNSALDEPLSWWRMSGLDHLTFGEFVESLARSPAKVAGVPQVVGDKAAAPPVAADGAAVPLMAAVKAAAHPGMPRLVCKLEDPAQLSFVSAGPAQLSFVSARPAQLSFVSARPAFSAGSVQFSALRAPPRPSTSRMPLDVRASRVPPWGSGVPQELSGEELPAIAHWDPESAMAHGVPRFIMVARGPGSSMAT